MNMPGADFPAVAALAFFLAGLVAGWCLGIRGGTDGEDEGEGER